MNADDYLAQQQALLPTGPALPREDEVLGALLALPAAEFARIEARARDLLEEADPRNTVELLPEWEAAYGLPDPCVGAGQTLQERQAALVARELAGGGQSPAYFISVAAALGYAITIEEFFPFRADISTADSRVNDGDWPFTWRVHAPAQTIIYFRADLSFADEPVERATDLVLECVLRRLAPAHTIVLFSYGS